MSRGDFARLQSDDVEAEAGPTRPHSNRRRRRAFTRFELCLLIPLVGFAAALAAFTIVYVIQHGGTVKPPAIVALACTGVVLIAALIMVVRRIQRPDWLQDLETGKKWQISAPVAGSFQNLTQAGTASDAKGAYLPLPDSRPPSPNPSTLSSKLRLAVKKTLQSPSLLSRSSFESRGDDNRCLLSRVTNGTGTDRISIDSSEDGTERRHSQRLWTSVFELSGDARLDQLREANLKRLSRESRKSRYEMGSPTTPVAAAGRPDEPAAAGDLTIVVTKPQPTASSLPPRPRTSQGIPAMVTGEEPRRGTLSFDPLRSNPVHFLRRDPSIRQTKSAHDLASLSGSGRAASPATALKQAATVEPPVLRRPRSAEPGPDRSRLGYELKVVSRPEQHQPQPEQRQSQPREQLQPRQKRKVPRLPLSPPPVGLPAVVPAAVVVVPPPIPAVVEERQTPSRAQTPPPRGLRRSPIPFETRTDGRNLRTVYQGGI